MDSENGQGILTRCDVYSTKLMTVILRLDSQNATRVAMSQCFSVLQLCHPVHLKTSVNSEFTHPSYPKVRDSLEDA